MGAYWLVVGFIDLGGDGAYRHAAAARRPFVRQGDRRRRRRLAARGAVHRRARGGLLFGISSLVLGCVVLKRLYGVGTGEALVVFFLHAIVEIAIGAMLWFTFPALLGRDQARLTPRGRPGSGSSRRDADRGG